MDKLTRLNSFGCVPTDHVDGSYRSGSEVANRVDLDSLVLDWFRSHPSPVGPKSGSGGPRFQDGDWGRWDGDTEYRPTEDGRTPAVRPHVTGSGPTNPPVGSVISVLPPPTRTLSLTHY